LKQGSNWVLKIFLNLIAFFAVVILAFIFGWGVAAVETLLIVAVSAVVFFFRLRRKNPILILGVEILIAITVLMIPYYGLALEIYEDLLNAPFVLVKSFVHSMHVFLIDTDYFLTIENIKNSGVGPTGIAADLYYWALLLSYLIAPLLTVGTVMDIMFSFIVNENCRFMMRIPGTKKKFYIFSELNEMSILLAEDIKHRIKDTEMVFCDVKRDTNENYLDRAKEINAFCINKSIDSDFFRWQIGKGEKLRSNWNFFNISKDESENLRMGLEHASIKDCDVYIVSESPEAEEMLEKYVSSENAARLHLIRQNERAILKLLYEKPLYEGLSTVEDIHVLLVGGGKNGLMALKNILWCGQMLNNKLKVTVIDKKVKDCEKRFMHECPGFRYFENHPNLKYDVEFVEKNIEHMNQKEFEEHFRDVNYIIVNLGSGHKNLDIAIRLRRIYRRFWDKQDPVIAANLRGIVKEDIPQGIMTVEKKCDFPDDKNPSSIPVGKRPAAKAINKIDGFQITIFGDLTDLFNAELLSNDDYCDDMEILAINISGYYKKDITDNEVRFSSSAVKKFFTSSPYDVRASEAAAIHLKYKMYALGEDMDWEMEKLRALRDYREQGIPGVEERWTECKNNLFLRLYREWIKVEKNESGIEDMPEERQVICNESKPELQLYLRALKEKTDWFMKTYPGDEMAFEREKLLKDVENAEKKFKNLDISLYDYAFEEHIRWMMYTLSEGFVPAEIETDFLGYNQDLADVYELPDFSKPGLTVPSEEMKRVVSDKHFKLHKNDKTGKLHPSLVVMPSELKTKKMKINRIVADVNQCREEKIEEVQYIQSDVKFLLWISEIIYAVMSDSQDEFERR